MLDPESGLYYYGGRYYDPELGRFISPDPFVPGPGDPQSFNRYSYVGNNPVNYTDPSGYKKKKKGGFFRSFFGKLLLSVVAAAILSPAASALAHAAAVASGASLPGAIAAGMLAGKVGAGIAAGATATALSGGNAGVGALLGGVGGLLGPSLGVGFGGGSTGAIASGIATGAALGGLSTAFYGGNFGENVGLGALSGGGAAGGIVAGPIVDVLQKDLAATAIGLGGNLLGAVGGLGDTFAGGITGNLSQVGRGLLSSLQALVPRYDTAFGLGYSLSAKPLTVIGEFAVRHDRAYPEGVFFSRLTTSADLQLIRDVWTRHTLGPIGQAYRVGLTGAFSLKILAQETLGVASQ